MIASRQKLFETISAVLRDQVLTELKPTTWAAANIRACLAMLTYLEDMIACDEPVLKETNAAMAGLMADLLVRNPPWLGAQLHEDVTAGLQAAPDGGVEELASGSTTLKTMLVNLIRRHGSAGAPDAIFTKNLRETLVLVNEGDAAPAKRSSKMQPF